MTATTEQILNDLKPFLRQLRESAKDQDRIWGEVRQQYRTRNQARINAVDAWARDDRLAHAQYVYVREKADAALFKYYDEGQAAEDRFNQVHEEMLGMIKRVAKESGHFDSA